MGLKTKVENVIRGRTQDLKNQLNEGPLPLLPMRVFQALERRAGGPSDRDHRDIPVVINNFNRLDPLRRLVDWLQRAGMRRVYILDNDSSYPPLLDYYRSAPCEVIYRGVNGRAYGFFSSSVFLRFCRDYYIYTDPDVVPTEECPLDAVHHLFELLQRYPAYGKVGLGLKIDDLPAHYDKHADVVAWESKFWQDAVAPDVYRAPVDTTFALYRPFARGGHWLPALRTGGAHTARHLPWYEDSAHPTEEDNFYRSVIEGSSHWMQS